MHHFSNLLQLFLGRKRSVGNAVSSALHSASERSSLPQSADCTLCGGLGRIVGVCPTCHGEPGDATDYACINNTAHVPACHTCGDTGYVKWADTVPCNYCGGTGKSCPGQT